MSYLVKYTWSIYMSTCTFFGHRNTPAAIQPFLKNAITELIITHNVTRFYVGNQGEFDRLVYTTLKELKEFYPQIEYYVVLAYLPSDKNQFSYIDFIDTVFPDNLTKVPPKFAISKRNIYMINKSDYVITYIKNHCSGAAQFAKKAKNKNKIVINLA